MKKKINLQNTTPLPHDVAEAIKDAEEQREVTLEVVYEEAVKLERLLRRVPGVAGGTITIHSNDYSNWSSSNAQVHIDLEMEGPW